MFDEVVINDSIQRFLEKKDQLSNYNYIQNNNKKDIFDNISPQKTNLFYTPKAAVKHMLDDLESKVHRIFDDLEKTFTDLYILNHVDC